MLLDSSGSPSFVLPRNMISYGLAVLRHQLRIVSGSSADVAFQVVAHTWRALRSARSRCPVVLIGLHCANGGGP
jgi:hypothetical protein